MLEITGLRKSYSGPQGRLQILDGVDLQLPHGQTLALMGESGSGKSTLLHLVAALDQADSGEVRVGEQRLDALNEAARAAYRRDSVAVIFQQFNLIPSLTVADNLAFQARLAGRLDAEWQASLTAELGLEVLLQRYPEQLSGGQQQRVAVGRALALRPALILADEPTGNLDERTADEVMALLLALVDKVGSSLLMVTHSSRLASRLDQQILLSNGRVQGAGR
ncbi:ABC transporter ATP-binding protein [Halopseudomonas pelagia]|uniref:ABC transporter ATP-binding protein n=1 Tax=Halopseudomonas pelagia TaxID=553151 RepID=A0AA91U347_9GAMM|nr:ABC transporter ATP-binding protein [Halopseudomonas pelagia]PCC99131.1 ABC transporter ATP-binding protein [Halopseudomonas pelagia]QFY58958.1 ABC transporter ATP-binding protein [Halopseudomonas pelagia]